MFFMLYFSLMITAQITGERMFSRKTKIVCSMGPTAESVDVISSLLKSGMNVARFNFSHSDHAYHKKNMENVRKASELTGIPCALLLDTKGPEIRTGLVPDNGKITINEGDTYLITNDDSLFAAVKNADGTHIPGRISSVGKTSRRNKEGLPYSYCRRSCRTLVLETDVGLLLQRELKLNYRQ